MGDGMIIRETRPGLYRGPRRRRRRRNRRPAAEASAAAIQPYDSRADAIAALPDLADTITRVSWREGNAILSSVRQTGAPNSRAGWATAPRKTPSAWVTTCTRG